MCFYCVVIGIVWGLYGRLTTIVKFVPSRNKVNIHLNIQSCLKSINYITRCLKSINYITSCLKSIIYITSCLKCINYITSCLKSINYITSCLKRIKYITSCLKRINYITSRRFIYGGCADLFKKNGMCEYSHRTYGWPAITFSFRYVNID